MNKRSGRLTKGIVAAGVTAASLAGAASAAGAEPLPQPVTVDPVLVERFLDLPDINWPPFPFASCDPFPLGIVVCDLPRHLPDLVPLPRPFPKGIPVPIRELTQEIGPVR